ncbi:MAG: hypothetical protein EA370_08390 [Wenzhouxiangella sp.]|nr:MAG: hypothetical protein EA370_08390 [Wenzhouxiangella sp.]
MTSPSDPDWEAVLKLFDTLVELPEPARREQLVAISKAKPKIAAEVAAMLAADQREQGILEASLELVAPGLNIAVTHRDK